MPRRSASRLADAVVDCGVKPTDIDEYVLWLRLCRGVDVTTRTEIYYNTVTSKVAADLEASPMWGALVRELREWHDEYRVKNGDYDLLTSLAPPKLDQKPFASFLHKTFRRNVVRNDNWPGPPTDGWVLPVNWFSEIQDIVRTLVVARYLDGAEFLKERLEAFGRDQGLSVAATFEARVEGYYAVHAVLGYNAEIPREDWDTATVPFSVEIQVTTQLQELMREHLHAYYDIRRLEEPRDPVEWQWDYRTDEFSTGYLGHILHYVEGMIMEVRQRQAGEEK